MNPEDSDPESEIQEEKESVRRNSGKTLRVPWSKGGMSVQKEAHWPARYRSITRVGDRPALRADAPTQRGLRTLQPSARASRREGAYKLVLSTQIQNSPPFSAQPRSKKRLRN